MGHTEKRLLKNIIETFGFLGEDASLIECDFFESYHFYPWDGRVNHDYSFTDHSYTSSVEIFLDLLDSDNRKIIVNELKNNKVAYKRHLASDVSNAILDRHGAGVYYLSERALEFYFLAWLYNAFLIDDSDIISDVGRFSNKYIKLDYKNKFYYSDLINVMKFLIENKRYKIGIENCNEIEKFIQNN